MDLAVKIFEGFAAMTDHGARESGHGFFGDFDWTGNEKLVVRDHRRKRPTSNAQRPTLNAGKSAPPGCYSFLIKLISPLRSTRATFTSEASSSSASNAVFRASDRLCPSRIMINVARKTMIPRREI